MPSDKLPTPETADLNFLDRNLVIELIHNPETVLQYPDITEEDFETKRERYRILLGKVGKVKDGHVAISVEAVMELEEGDLPAHLEVKEGSREVRNINLRAIRKLFETIKNQHPELSELDLIGDMHTHPVKPEELDGNLKPWQPSQEDLNSVIQNYKDGTLNKDKPFIFSIAGPDEKGKIQYAFYRLIYEDNKYKVEALFIHS